MDCTAVGLDFSLTVQLYGWIYHGLYSSTVGFIMDCTAVGLDLSWIVQQ